MEQDPNSVAKNRAFFNANERYASQVDELRTYRNIRVALEQALSGIRRLIDIGNGGVFDYDTRIVEHVVAVDLFPAASRGLPENATVKIGDALRLPEPDGSYDGALMVNVLHHLVGRDAGTTHHNIQKAIGEAWRVLEADGRFVLVESCVPSLLFPLERALFAPLRLVAATRLMQHPATLQFPAPMIEQLLRERFNAVSVARIPVGPWIIQFGHRWPTPLTPARPYIFICER